MAYDRLVMLNDTEKSWTFKAGSIISGGDLVGFTSGTDIVSSGGAMGGWKWSEIEVCAEDAALENFVGIAITNAAKAAAVGVMMQGLFVLPAGSGGVVGGDAVIPAGYANMVNVNVATGSVAVIGRALSTGTAETGFAIVRLY